jgi:hypothetical protein
VLYAPLAEAPQFQKRRAVVGRAAARVGHRGLCGPASTSSRTGFFDSYGANTTNVPAARRHAPASATGAASAPTGDVVYPTDAAVYGFDAADLLEVRAKRVPGGVAIASRSIPCWCRTRRSR